MKKKKPFCKNINLSLSLLYIFWLSVVVFPSLSAGRIFITFVLEYICYKETEREQELER